tara:strand:- start:169 stop:1008 length:840 start_codon:yes stop_codon:yes gene_type:complete
MTFINNFKIINKPFFVKNNVYMLNKNNLTIYNPIIGSNLGIPLNLLQYIYTTSHYGENIINNDLILLQFAIGIFTYGTDRFLDALEYDTYTYSNNSIYNLEKSNYYDYLLKNKNLNIIVLLSSYLYILSLLINNIENYPFIILLTSTLGYKNLKKNYGQFKAIYIGIFWTFGTFLLPCVLHDSNYEVLNDPYIYLSSILSMFGSSNLLDIKDIEEDKKENINTLPVLYGKKNSIIISNFSIFLSMLIFYFNNNFYNNIFVSGLFELQNFGSFFLTFNNN